MRKFMVHCIAMMLVSVAICEAQESDSVWRMVKYTPDYQFREGIFLNFEQVRNNNPLPKSRILTSVDYSDRDFFQKLLAEETIKYFDGFGMRKEVETEDIWGYSKNGVLYIGLGGGFHRITVIGSICHFLASIISYDGQYYDPYYNRYAFYDYYYYNRRPNTYTKTEVRQFLLDFETGEVVDYDVTNLEVILMKDPELHDEYATLRRRKKKQQKFLFIRRFNERNPVYLPAVD
ncbi:MAG TPA: hypothetical protein ENN63_05665 [Bacteroidetes bacterium]|nr:hypothetical protein [Bacteroidota bacterium]